MNALAKYAINFNPVGLMFNPLYKATTGQWLGEAAEEGTLGQGRRAREASELSDFQGNLAQQQMIRAGELQQELDEQGRPMMRAEVDRLSEVASLAEQYAREGMPEAQRQAAVNDIQRNQAMMLGGASSLGGGLRGLGSTQASTARSYRDLAAQDAAIAQQNQNQYLRSLSNLSQAESRQEGFNVIAPYQEKQAEMQALLGSGIQNQMGMLGFNYQNAAQTEQMLMDLGATAGQLAATGGMSAPMAMGGGSGGATPPVTTPTAYNGLDMNSINSATPFSAGYTP